MRHDVPCIACVLVALLAGSLAPAETAAPTTATAPAPVATAATLTQYGITWTFDAPAKAGRFVTGDWWVVGPLTVTAITPAPAEGRSGSMVLAGAQPARTVAVKKLSIGRARGTFTGWPSVPSGRVSTMRFCGVRPAVT